MGAYFRNYDQGDFLEKVLIRKKNGSQYPDFNDFSGKIDLLKKYLVDFVVDSWTFYRNNKCYIKQSKVKGVDLFILVKDQPYKINRQSVKRFTSYLEKLYNNTDMLPDLIGHNNVIYTNGNKIKLIDVWPLFYSDRVVTKDLDRKSYQDNLSRFKTLKHFSKLN